MAERILPNELVNNFSQDMIQLAGKQSFVKYALLVGMGKYRSH
jgi:hypothetical protein